MSARDRRHDYQIKNGCFPGESPVRVPEFFNIAEACLMSHARAFPQAVALMDLSRDAQIWTYADMARAAERLAAVWQDQGLQPGDRVAILLPQCAEALIAHFAAHLIGAVSLPLFVLFGPDALRFRLKDSGAKILVSDQAQYPKICEIQPELPDLDKVYLRDGASGLADGLWGAIEAQDAPYRPIQTRAEDPAMMIYTSGTTGNPKGVLHAHRFLLGHLPCLELSFADFPNGADIGWTPADWAWIGGLMDMAIPCFYFRVPLVAKRFERFTAGAAFDLIRDAQITRAFLPPTALKMMRQAEGHATAQLRSISSGGEPLSAELIGWAKEALGAEVNELYGQTECNLSAGSARSLGVAQSGWIGQAFPGFDMRILDEKGQAVPDGQIGQICVHRDTPTMFLRYWNQPQKTAERFVGDYLMTGDLGRMDAQGYVQFMARDDDVITSSGYRIGPAEIEAVLARAPQVVMAAVVAAPDATRGHVIGAYVTVNGPLEPGFEADLIGQVAAQLSPHMAPKWVRVLEEMP
ncbi:MAG: AMP-binding protein, partial [Rhodobacteraceae bacterium]|nr:AMP-binding protein [Paracoccaceae bacterium]